MIRLMHNMLGVHDVGGLDAKYWDLKHNFGALKFNPKIGTLSGHFESQHDGLRTQDEGMELQDGDSPIWEQFMCKMVL